jgi:hypothetical protein
LATVLWLEASVVAWLLVFSFWVLPSGFFVDATAHSSSALAAATPPLGKRVASFVLLVSATPWTLPTLLPALYSATVQVLQYCSLQYLCQ